ncbi:FxsA family protein [uncultured Friedmanniella sp.]|uniref:FxsA family protein n=1 Tax=uncultured Friedmanniella sp. TaxID=335381 RepID=UPI0035CBC5F9
MRPRRGWPFAVTLLLLVAVPILEVWLLIQVGHAIGAWPTVAVLVLEALLGAALLRHQGRRTWRSLTDSLARGVAPSGQLADAALVLCGGLLLMLPGFATDVVGLLFLLPFTRPLARRLLAAVLARRLGAGPLPRRGDIIEGETVDNPHPTVISGEVLDR